jgi:hypothetical protein
MATTPPQVLQVATFPGPPLWQELGYPSAQAYADFLEAQAVAAADAAIAQVTQATADDRTATGQDRVAAAGSATAAACSATAAAGSATATGQDRVATGQDRTQTGQDRTATGQDRTQTGLDRSATATSAGAADASAKAAAGSATSTAADRTQTGLDRAATGADRTATGADRAQTALDRAATSTIANTGVGLVFPTYAALAASPAPAANTGAIVADADAGTHADPVTGGTVQNAGVYRYSTSPAGWQFVAASTAAQTAAAAALSYHYANDSTDADVPGGSPGDRGAKFYALQSQFGVSGAVSNSGYSTAPAQRELNSFTATNTAAAAAYATQSLAAPVAAATGGAGTGGKVTVFAVFDQGSVAPGAKVALFRSGTGAVSALASFANIGGKINVAVLQNTNATLTATALALYTTGVASFGVTYVVVPGDVTASAPANVLSGTVASVLNMMARSLSPLVDQTTFGVIGALTNSGYDTAATLREINGFTAGNSVAGKYCYATQPLAASIPAGGKATVFIMYDPGSVAPSAQIGLFAPGTGVVSASTAVPNVNGNINTIVLTNNGSVDATQLAVQTVGVASYGVTYLVVPGDATAAVSTSLAAVVAGFANMVGRAVNSLSGQLQLGVTGAVSSSGYDTAAVAREVNSLTVANSAASYAYAWQSLAKTVAPGGKVTVFAIYDAGSVAPAAQASLFRSGTGVMSALTAMSNVVGGMNAVVLTNTGSVEATQIAFHTTGVANLGVTYIVLPGDLTATVPTSALAGALMSLANLQRRASAVNLASIRVAVNPGVSFPGTARRRGTTYTCTLGSLSLDPGTATASYQWFGTSGATWAPIAGATAATYTSVASDDWTLLRCLVTWTLGKTKLSAWSEFVPNGNDTTDGRLLVIFAGGQSNMDTQDTTQSLDNVPQDARIFEGVNYRYGPNLASNGQFANGATGLTALSATLAVANNVLTATATADYGGFRMTVSGLVPGRTYALWAFMRSTQQVQMRPSVNLPAGSQVASAGAYLRQRFVANAETEDLTFQFSGKGVSGQTFDVSDVQVREIVTRGLVGRNPFVEPPIGPAPILRTGAYGRGNPAGWFARRKLAAPGPYSGVVIFMCAVGGTGMVKNRWDCNPYAPQGDLARNFIDTMTAAALDYASMVDSTGARYVDFITLYSGHETDAAGWGGSSNGTIINAANCTAAFGSLIAASRLVDGLTGMKWVLGGMTPEWIAADTTGGRQAYETNVLQALGQSIAGVTYRVGPSGYAKTGDIIHYTGYPGQQVRGYDWADNVTP